MTTTEMSNSHRRALLQFCLLCILMAPSESRVWGIERKQRRSASLKLEKEVEELFQPDETEPLGIPQQQQTTFVSRKLEKEVEALFQPDEDERLEVPRADSFLLKHPKQNHPHPTLRGGSEPILRPAATSSTTTGASYGGTFRSAQSTSSNGYPYKSNSGNQYAARSWNTYPRKTARRTEASSGNSVFQPFQSWWSNHVSPNLKQLPKIQCRVEPTTTLKIRKTFRPLKTIVQMGADFNTQLGVWQFKSSWEDALIGGKLTLAGRELQFQKSWQLSVGAMEDLVTRLRLRAAVDLQTWKAYMRMGFRTERLAPINVMEGFTVLKQIPLDGNKGHVKLEVKANFALPEPEIEYSTETQGRSLIGMGDIEINIDELNLLLDY